MSYDDEYRGLIEDVRDAIDKLLRESTSDSLLRLRAEYGGLCQMLEHDDRERTKAVGDRQRNEQTARLEERRKLERIWDEASVARRESLLFDALRDERLTLRETTARLNVVLKAPDRCSIVYQPSVRSLVMRLFREGQLERVAETFKGKPRFRYFRKRALEGPIVDLERAYHEEGDGSAT